MINYTESIDVRTKSMITTAKSDGMIIEQVEHEYRPIPDNKVDSNKQT